MKDDFESKPVLQKAIQAIELGDKATGQRLLAEFIKTDPHNETAWLWMSAVADSPQQKIYCFQRVLKINPENEEAKRGLLRTENNEEKEIQSVNNITSTNLPSSSQKDTLTRLEYNSIFSNIWPPSNPIRLWTNLGIGFLTIAVINGVFSFTKIRPSSSPLITLIFGFCALGFAGVLRLIRLNELTPNLRRHIKSFAVAVLPLAWIGILFLSIPKAILLLSEGSGRLTFGIIFCLAAGLYVLMNLFYDLDEKQDRTDQETKSMKKLSRLGLLIISISMLILICGLPILLIARFGSLN